MSASKLAGGRAAPVDAEPPRNAPGEGRFRGGYHMRFLRMLVRLYWLRLRTQPVQEALAVAGIAIGVALIFAVEIANTSVPASVRQLEHAVEGKASLEVAARSPEGFDQTLVSKVAEAPGVFGASGVLDAHVTLVGPHGHVAVTLFGAEAGIGAIGGPLARRVGLGTLEDTTPAAVQSMTFANQLRSAHVDTIALPEGPAHVLGASPGQLLLLDVAGRSVAVLCGRVLNARLAGAAAESPVAISLLPAVQRITGLQHRITHILVLPQHGQEGLARTSLMRLAGRELNVRPSDSEVSLLEDATRSSSQVATLFVALSVIVGLLFAYNAMLLTLPARRRYVTRLRNAGAYRHELAGLLALEVLVLGVVASLLGLLLGDVFSRALFGGIPRYLTAGFPIGTQRVITPTALALAIGGGVLATMVAAAAPAIETARGHPLEVPSESVHRSLSAGKFSAPFALAFGVGVIVAAIPLGLLFPGGGLVAVGAVAVALGFVLAPAVPWLVERSKRLALRVRSASGYVATIELQAAPTRARAVAATSAIAVYAIVAVGATLNDIRRGVTRTTRAMFGTSAVVVSPSSFSEAPFPVQPFPPAPVLARLRTINGITQPGLLRSSFLDVGTHRLLLIVEPQTNPVPVPASQIIQGSSLSLARRLNSGGWVALSSTLAREWHLHVNEQLVLPTPSGYARFRLAATINNYGWPPGALVMSSADYTRLWRTTGTTILLVRFRPGITEAQGLRAVRDALSGTGLVTSTRRAAEAGGYTAANQGMSQLSQISVLLLAAAVLAVIATMAGSIWQRRPRLASLRRLGMYRLELVKMIYLETGVAVLIGCLIGAALGLLGQPLATSYIRNSTGFPELYAPGAWLSVRTVVVATTLAVVATGLLGYFVTSRALVWKAAT